MTNEFETLQDNAFKLIKSETDLLQLQINTLTNKAQLSSVITRYLTIVTKYGVMAFDDFEENYIKYSNMTRNDEGMQ